MLILLMPECRISFCFFLFSSISFFMLVLFSELYVTPGCVGSRLLSRIFSSCSEQGLPSGCGARVSRYSSSSLCGAPITSRNLVLLEIKTMTNLESILKSRDITLLTKVRTVKAMVFPVVKYGCENWTIKKAER